MKFLVDANLPPRLCVWLRSQRRLGYLRAAKTDSCRLFSRTPKKNGKAEGEAGRLSVKWSTVTRSASYEPQYGGGSLAKRMVD